MKSIARSITATVITMIVMAAAVFAADAPATATTATTSTFQEIINWVTGNQVIVGGLIVAILDFIFAINPDWKTNGALHFIYTLAQGRAANSGNTNPPAPPTAPAA